MKLETQEIERIAGRLSEGSERVVKLQMMSYIRHLEKLCESPIEALFGAAFHFAANAPNWIVARANLVFLNDPLRSRKPLLPAQWELVPQYKWESYRIDFAIFSELSYPVFVECDGHDFHERTKEQAANDREKDRKVQSAGIPILRFTGSQLNQDPVGCGFEVYNFIYERVRQSKEKTA